MISYRKNKKWKSIFLNIELEKIENLDIIVEKAVNEKMSQSHLKGQMWDQIDIVDIKIISEDANTNSLNLLVFVATNVKGMEV